MGTSAAAEVSHVRSLPRVPATATPVTLQSLYDLLLVERATRLEERVSRQRLEAILLEKHAAVIQKREAQVAFRVTITDELEELSGYCLILGREFRRLNIFFNVPSSIYEASTGHLARPPPLEDPNYSHPPLGPPLPPAS